MPRYSIEDLNRLMGNTLARNRAFSKACKADPYYADDPEFHELFDAAIELIDADAALAPIPEKYMPLIARYVAAKVRSVKAEMAIDSRDNEFKAKLTDFLSRWQNERPAN